MTHGDLKVVKVYMRDGKQVAYGVQNAICVQMVDINGIRTAIQYGHSFINATYTRSGVFRVSSDVPRVPFDPKDIPLEEQLRRIRKYAYESAGGNPEVSNKPALDYREVPLEESLRRIRKYAYE